MMTRYRWTLRILGGCLLGIAAMIMCYYVYELLIRGMDTLFPALRCILLVCAPLFSGMALLDLSTPLQSERQKVGRIVFRVLFGFYLLALFGTLVFCRISLTDFAGDWAAYMADWELMTNFVPFKTIGLYIRCLRYDFIGTAIPLSNLMGNVLLFMPMAVFLPCLFPSTRRFFRFLLLMVAILVAVEALQLALCCGSCDIDDVILNLLGTLPAYGLTMAPRVRGLLERVGFYVPEPAVEH